MGQWNITIRGTGSHHNAANPHDANRMAAEFVQALKNAGHSVLGATFTFGAEDDVANATQYLSSLGKTDDKPAG